MSRKVSTAGMSRKEWLEERNKSIGGSDAACVLGLNEYKSAYALWCEKTGKVTPEDISDKEAVRLGNDLEQYVAQRWAEATGKKFRRENSILHNEAYPFAHANPDRMVVGEKAGLECKTTSSWEIAKQVRDGQIPAHWYCQCVHYLMVTGADRWSLGVLVFGAGFYHFVIERNEEEIAALADAERVFWDGVTNDTPPALDGAESTGETIKTIYRESRPGETVDLGAVGSHIEAYNALGKQIEELEALRAEHENEIKCFMGSAEKGIYGGTTVTWKSASRKTFDRSLYEKTFGTIPDQFYKNTPVRTFRVAAKN